MAAPLNPVDHLDHLLYTMVHINDLHYSYLYAHENLQKLKEKKRLEGLIREYLMVAPHEKKFCYSETSLILHKSAELKENFSGIRASAAWTAIAAYAHNLLAQSWRREFREIKTYSGFYKHNIENGLVGSELMLNLMGYRETGDGTFTLDGPVDPDKVANVSRDSLVALVECQILCSLYSDLLKTGCPYSWLDVLEYREAHPCTVEQALNGLKYQYYQRYLSGCRLDCYSKCNVIDDTHHTSYKSPHFRIPSNIHLPFYDTTDSLSMMSYSHLGNPLTKNAACHKDFSLSPLVRQRSVCSVPTGQLIELDVPCHGKDNYGHDTDNQKKAISDQIHPQSSFLSANNNNANFVKPKYNNDVWDTWGASYLSSENKDNSKYEALSDKKLAPSDDFDEAFKCLQLDSPQPSCSTYEPKFFEKTVEKNPKKWVKQDSNIAVGSSSQTLERDKPKKPDINYMSLKVKLNDKWECPTCTFHNTNDKDVCEMCSKSKMSGNEVQPLVSGGRQCPKCTLVNEKGVTACDACGTDLKDSPTYI